MRPLGRFAKEPLTSLFLFVERTAKRATKLLAGNGANKRCSWPRGGSRATVSLRTASRRRRELLLSRSDLDPLTAVRSTAFRTARAIGTAGACDLGPRKRWTEPGCVHFTAAGPAPKSSAIPGPKAKQRHDGCTGPEDCLCSQHFTNSFLNSDPGDPLPAN